MPRPKIYDDGISPQLRYSRKNRSRISIDFYTDEDKKLLEHIQRQPNKQGYIKGLIRQDMEKEKGES